MADFVMHDAFDLLEPDGDAAPLIYDSPHSGTLYPDDFAHAVERLLLVGGEDRFVDDLVVDAPRHGIALLRALFARTYIDPNRDPTDLDPLLLPDDWPEAVEARLHSGRGIGLIFRLIGEDRPIYDRRLGGAEIRHRIASYWEPYHQALQARIDALHETYGAVWHVDWHSMQPVGNALSPDPGERRADFVLGDRFGQSCAPGFTACVADLLGDLGYTVAVNRPYAGAYIVERQGRPAEGRHSLQIEINRGLYMDAGTLEASPGMVPLRAALGEFSRRLAEWTRRQ